MQLTHYNSRFQPHQFPIILICENVTNAANIGSLFRTADAFGIEKLIFCGQPLLFNRKMAKSSRATEKYVNYEWHAHTETVLKTLKEAGRQIIALEITDESVPLSIVKLDAKTPIVLLIGDENFGISEPCLELAHLTVHINMFGQNSSMNVVQAASIGLYEITRQMEV